MENNNQDEFTRKVPINPLDQYLPIGRFHDPLPVDVVKTTEDRLRLCIQRHVAQLEKKKAWITPLAMFLTIMITLCSSNFNDFILEKATWKAIFIICGGLSFIWLISSLEFIFKKSSIDDLILEIEKDCTPRKYGKSDDFSAMQSGGVAS